MLIKNHDFGKHASIKFVPTFPVKIINPHHKLKIETPYYLTGIIDTGASECCVPSFVAPDICHEWTAGVLRKIDTASGKGTAYAHCTTINIYHPDTNELIYTINDKMIDFCRGLKYVLLGHKSFLRNFILNIDYLERKYSLIQKDH